MDKEKCNRNQEQKARIEHSLVKKYKKTIWNRFVKGVKTYELIEPGDRIAVCISGGKDSMLLAKCMQRLQKYSDVPFEVTYLVMDPGYRPENQRRILENAALLELPVKVFASNIFHVVEQVEDSPCYVCARMRRGALYNFAEELGCNKIALGHHFDDVVETILMAMLYGAQIQTMLPKLFSTNYTGMQLIRPLYLVRESDIIAWARYNDLHFIQCACRVTERLAEVSDSGSVSKRQEVKELLAQLRQSNPNVDYHIFRSVENVNLDMLISYHKGNQRHHFLDAFHEENL